jgi:hypothetical protein
MLSEAKDLIGLAEMLRHTQHDNITEQQTHAPLCKQGRTWYDSASERKVSLRAERKGTHGSLLHTRRS